MPIERIEVFLDDAPTPVQVLKHPPFRVTYDTRTLPDGDHHLQVITHYTNGSREIKEIPFRVANTPGVLVQGLEAGKEVSGHLDLTLRVADPDIKPARDRFPGVAAVIATVVVLGAVWLFFAVTGSTNKTLEEVAPPPSKEAPASGGEQAAAGQATAGPAPAVDAALLKAGEGVFTTNCAGCHQAGGTGVPGVFPPLAGNPHLADVKHVTNTIIHGLNVGVVVNGQKYSQAMPPFGQLSDQDVAAVATYIRNSWGNKFGGVTPAEAKASR
ncbi:c-type cytochrome [Meiothermus granaticius]|uniref:Cytochrome c-552 n=1 Tax=Meiothermus granaticius NBRC 107808 TaxID=1227551 RepID=A0A399F5R2_9DEIN|nr:cytochrome c [Meiothermus granaticius]RIH91410.1 Cytochrome c-552 [Meiothermus granaticius NBRC 107808]GEM87081.1 cytochrome c [Meiothermus granaticius NBRC 107808]